MSLRRLCQSIARWGVVGCVGLYCESGGAMLAEETSTPNEVSLESYYRALLEPCMADGVISPAERRTILAIAAKSLARSEMAELERRIEATSETVTLPGTIYVPCAPVSHAKAGKPEATLKPAVPVEEPATIKQAEATEIQMVQPSPIENAVDMPPICDSCHTGICDNLSLFATWEGFKGPVDLGDRNGNFGIRLGLNWGYPLWEEYHLGIQAGSAVTLADFRGTQFTDDDERVQSFTTIGLFQRSPCGVNWGVVYDFLSDDYYHEMDLQQWRAQVGYEVSCCDEVGIWFARGTRGDSGVVFSTNPLGGPPIAGVEHRDVMTQGSLFWRRVWSNDAATRAWLGLAEEHGEWVVGGDATVPLCSSLALVGEVNYIIPSAGGFPAGAAEEIWSLSLGIAIYPGHSAMHATHSCYAPLLPVANNGTFAVDKLPE